MIKLSQFKKNFLYVLSANGVGLILSVLMNIILPVVFKEDVISYGYVQLYLLYVSYYYLFDLGLSNGVYLREGGNEYKNLNKKTYIGQFIALTVSQALIGILISIFAFTFIDSADKQYVLYLVSINILIMQQKTLLTAILQSTNRIKEYSITVIICKLLNALSIVFVLILGIRDYKLLIMLLTIGELASLFYAIYQCKEIVFCKPDSYDIVKKEIKANISAGYSLLISGVSAMLMTGIARLAIENQWGIEAFAKVSLTITLTNTFMLFINAVSTVLYPQMRRTSDEKYVSLYNQMRCLLMLILFTAMIFYYPMRLSLEHIMPQYHESFIYMAILLPICLYSSKMALLIQTYMKVLRLERKLMIVNLISLGVSIILTIFSVYIFKDMIIAVFAILISQIIRAILAELVLSKYIKINVIKDIIYEFVMTIGFVFANWIIGGWIGAAVFVVFYLIYLILKKDDIKSSIPLMLRKSRID